MCEGPLFTYAHHRPRKLGTAAHHPEKPFAEHAERFREGLRKAGVPEE